MYGFKALAAKRPSDWQGKWANLDSLPDEIEYVMLTFEDALFLSPVNGAAERDCRSDDPVRTCPTSACSR